jgi:pyridoxal phosphate enzyme (YggS family)
VTRSDVLAANLAAVKARIAAAATRSGRDPDAVRLLAVSKTFPASDVVLLHSLGQREFGENKHQDAEPKVAEVASDTVDVCWHFLGQLQRNKATAVARYADVLHSLDRMALLGPLERAVAARGRPRTELIPVELDGSDPGRGGAAPTDVIALAAAAARTDGIVLGGVMAIAPRGTEARRAFAQLREVSDRLRGDHPDASVISAGMSQDLEAAIAEGSTLVRVGTALFGGRTPGLG